MLLESMSQRDLPVVLLIDDDLVSREVTATLLTLSGYTVHTAESGEAGLHMLAEGQFVPGVILCDAQMPGLCGVELIAELRKVCQGVPIHVISGSRPPDELVAAADGLLLKPFDASALWRLFEREPEERKASYIDPDEAVVSTAVLAKLRQMMPEKAVREIYVAMVADLDKRIEALGGAIGRHDHAEVRRIGHAIKGGCSMAGAMQAARLGALLETQNLEEDNQLDNSRTLLADLRAAARSLRRILEDKLPA
jgi:CheY-like chemotaxis protein